MIMTLVPQTSTNPSNLHVIPLLVIGLQGESVVSSSKCGALIHAVERWLFWLMEKNLIDIQENT